jgi:hypothetical protein
LTRGAVGLACTLHAALVSIARDVDDGHLYLLCEDDAVLSIENVPIIQNKRVPRNHLTTALIKPPSYKKWARFGQFGFGGTNTLHVRKDIRFCVSRQF